MLSVATAFPVAGSDRSAAPLPAGAGDVGAVRPVTMVRAETLNFFFDDVDGLLGAPVVDRKNKKSGKVMELIVEKDGSVSGMILALSLDQPRNAMTGIAGQAFVAATESFVRRKAPANDLVVIETLSGDKIVKVEDHIADLHDFPTFTPIFATDSF